MDPFEALYGIRCKCLFGLFEIGIHSLVCLDLVFEAIGIIFLLKERLKKAQSTQKSYVFNRKRDLEFCISDWVYLKISIIKGVMRFGKTVILVPGMWAHIKS